MEVVTARVGESAVEDWPHYREKKSRDKSREREMIGMVMELEEPSAAAAEMEEQKEVLKSVKVISC